jgi:hypothetical protein
MVQSFIPRFEVATLQPPQTRLIPKLGGLPWGFPVELWPDCRECGEPLALLAQLPHQEPMLDLGNARWVLHLFQCATAGCSTWSHAAGCNAAVMLPHEALGAGLARPRRPTRLHGELWIVGWDANEDTIPPQLSAAYYDFDAFHALPEDLQFPHDFADRHRTKAGGLPYWTVNGPQAIPQMPGAPFDYLMQIDTILMLSGGLPDPAAVGCAVDRYQGRQVETRQAPSNVRRENAPWSVMQQVGEDDDYEVQFANFGSDGTLYVFIDRQATPPRVLLFWNR